MKARRDDPGGPHAITRLAPETLARAQSLVVQAMELRATAAELSVIADDLRHRAKAECERARSLAQEGRRADARPPPFRRQAVARPVTAAPAWLG